MKGFAAGFLACYALAWIASSSILYASQRMSALDVVWRGSLWPYAITILWDRPSWLGPNREPSHDR